MSSIAKAYVQIIPSAKGVKSSLEDIFNSEGSSAGTSFGNTLIGKVKNLVAAAGIGKALGESLTAGANLQQSLGGIETLFKDSADLVIANAEQAYKTAGMSANQYMEMVTGFSASLLQGLGGDTEKAAAIADMALTDMSDNANKMGTSMELIQNAYQGFAKQNYTMLDNLKLGYGGTKTEMERLLADAQALTGVKYDISNLSDVYEAIHVIQEEMGITGTTALESAATFSGSLASMKAAFSDLLANLATGRDISASLQAVGDTVFTFVEGNLLPMLGSIVSTLPDLFIDAFDLVGAKLSVMIPEMSGVFENLETVVVSLTAAMVAYRAATAISSVIDALKAATEGQTIAQTLLNAVMNANPFVLVATLVAGLVAAIVTLWNTNDGFRAAVTSAWESVKSTVSSVVESLVGFFTSTVPQAISTLVTGITDIPGKISSIFSGFSWGEIGSNIISGIAKGISNGVGAIISAAKQAAQAALNAAKRFLGIASPSKVMRDQVGKFIPAGLALGIEANTKPLEDAMHGISNMTLSTFDTQFNMGGRSKIAAASENTVRYGDNHFNITVNAEGIDGINDLDILAEVISMKIADEVERRKMFFA